MVILFSQTGDRILVLDAAVAESHEGDTEITEHPIETGGNVADHVRRKTETVKIEGVIAASPLPGQPGQVVRSLDGFVEVTALDGARPGRVPSAYQALLRLKDTAQIITLDTPPRSYPSMVLASLSVPRDAKTGDSLRFSATFREIRFAESQLVALKGALRSSSPFKPKDLGNQTTPAASAQAKGESQTIARAAAFAISDTFNDGVLFVGESAMKVVYDPDAAARAVANAKAEAAGLQALKELGFTR